MIIKRTENPENNSHKDETGETTNSNRQHHLSTETQTKPK